MGALDKLIYLESISLARYRSIVYIDRANCVINIFQNVENEHQYAYIETENSKYTLNIGNFYVDNNGHYFIDTPIETFKINKTDRKKIKNWIDASSELILDKENIIAMSRNKFFNYNLTNK